MAITFQNDGVYRVTAFGLWKSSVQTRAVHQLKLISGGPLTQAAGLSDIDAWLTFVINVLVAVQTTLHIWRGLSVETLDGVQSTGFVPLTAGDIPGLVAGDPAPSGVSMLQYMPTGVTRKQLRKYWPGMAEANIAAGGGFSAAAVAQAALVSTYYLGNQTLPNGVWRFGHALAGLPATWVTPESVVTPQIPSYQRRRREGRGI